MNLLDIKNILLKISTVNFKLPNGDYVPEHFHITEVGLVTKHFIDCGGTERKKTVVNFQLWEDGDYDHRLAPQKFLNILTVLRKITDEADNFDIEVEYQESTIGKFGLIFDGIDFVLVNKQTDCLAKDTCGIPKKEKQNCCSSVKTECC